jgi:16S rRNA (cytosine1402-N4)-methyltransferase
MSTAHSEAVVTRRRCWNARCTVYGIDRDSSAIAKGRALSERFEGRLTLIHGRFSEMDALLATRGITQADGVALDLGLSSMQLDDSARGFAFSHDGPLDMRMDASEGESAADLVNTLSEASLADLLRRYGEEKRAKTLARAVVAS